MKIIKNINIIKLIYVFSLLLLIVLNTYVNFLDKILREQERVWEEKVIAPQGKFKQQF